MPYAAYWERLESAYRVGALPSKAAREAHLAEIRSVRLITLNYCPMGCTFCSATNFLHEAQGSVASIARLEADECLHMIERIVAAHPRVRTIIFQDDIFSFTHDRRILPLCEGIVAAKRSGRIPAHLQFISTNRIDAMTPERLSAMRRAGFRVLGFGIESFSQRVLAEFNKAQIHRHIEPMLDGGAGDRRHAVPRPHPELAARAARRRRGDAARGVSLAARGCEIGMYPYVIPFSGAAFAKDPKLAPTRTTRDRQVAGTDISWQQPAKILPMDPVVTDVILRMERSFEATARAPGEGGGASAVARALAPVDPVLAADHGRARHFIADESEVRAELYARLPTLRAGGGGDSQPRRHEDAAVLVDSGAARRVRAAGRLDRAVGR